MKKDKTIFSALLPFLRLFRKIAEKSNYLFRHVCLSVCLSARSSDRPDGTTWFPLKVLSEI